MTEQDRVRWQQAHDLLKQLQPKRGITAAVVENPEEVLVYALAAADKAGYERGLAERQADHLHDVELSARTDYVLRQEIKALQLKHERLIATVTDARLKMDCEATWTERWEQVQKDLDVALKDQ